MHHFLLTDENGVFDYDIYDEMCNNNLELDVINDSMGEHDWCYIGFSFINVDPFVDTDANVSLSLTDVAVKFHNVQNRIEELLKQFNIEFKVLPSDIKFVSMVRLC